MSEADLMTLFGEALERSDAAERAAYLDNACGDDAKLRKRVEALLAGHEGAGRFLEPDATEIPDSAHPSELPTGDHRPDDTVSTLVIAPGTEGRGGSGVGQVIAGRYTLLDLLGEGGMGTVYRAEQTAPVHRQVALKLIKIGMDSRVVLARFDAERQALALMDHPNIARVFDGGTTEAGQPFFVMELVDGEPITDYSDRKRLTVQARLELFVAVCQAVQHAHQKGIIHRDLKPGNVLVAEVDGRPTPKVIDFGVAKATEFKLTEQTLGDTGAIVGTPTYMSPEQADPSSMDIDTRTDIYALGVLLYELLAGSPPIDARQFRRAGLLEMLRMVREDDPPRPSTKVSSADALPNIAASRAIDPDHLKRALRGDLDWIVMKALEKDRTRRYDTANGFAADILRHLAYEPVQAAPPSQAYRLRKFVRKNRGAVIAVSLVILALLVGIAGTTWGLIRADRALDAEARRVIERDEALKKEAERVKERDAAVRVADGRADELKYRLGVSDMVLATKAYEGGDLALASELLDNIPQEQRGWIWRYLKRQTHGGLFTLYGHTGSVQGASFSPDGTKIVTGSWDQTARVWDARTGMILFELKGHTFGLTSASFSPDGTKIVTGSEDDTARVWDARTGVPLIELKGHANGVMSASFSPDGLRIITGSRDETARVWDARTGATLLELKGHRHSVTSVSFSPDGSRIVTGSWDHTARVWDAQTGTTLLVLEGQTGYVSSVSFSPDGTRIITGGFDGKARVWDVQTGVHLIELRGHTNEVLSVSFSADGTRIITGSVDRTARVWDARTGTPLLELKGHRNKVFTASFSPDGSQVVTGSEDKTAKVWDARTGTSSLELKGHKDGIFTASFSPDGVRIVTGSSESTARIWDARTGIPLIELIGHSGMVSSASFSPDGLRVVTGSADGTAWVWDARTGVTILELKGHTDGVASVSFSPDGSRIITGSRDQVARVWDARTGVMTIELKGYTYVVSSASFSPDGSRVIIGSSDRTPRVRDARTGTSLIELKGSPGFVTDATFSPDGSRILATTSKSAWVWDARTGAPLIKLKGPKGGMLSALFSPDGSRIISTSGRPRVWDARTGVPLIELKGHTGMFSRASLSEDSSRILTGVFEQKAWVWDARTGTPLIELKGHSGYVMSATFSPDGSQILIGGEDDTARVWDAWIGVPLIELKGQKDEVVSISFSRDGSRIVTHEMSGWMKLWDARTGQELEGTPFPTDVSDGPISPDGRWFAHIIDNLVELVPIHLDAKELEYRRIHTRPNLGRYREGYKEAKKAKDAFAARFYLNLIPPAEREALETSELDRTFPADPFAG